MPLDILARAVREAPLAALASPFWSALMLRVDADSRSMIGGFRLRRRREREEAKEDAAQEKERERRQKAIANAQAALDEATREHDERAATLNDRRDALEKKSQAEDERWVLEKKKLESALRRARD
jgi:flagellar motility protein MotE (MotC chaperone)